MKPGVTALVIAQDAAASIAACLDALSFADEIVVVDGGSRDDTVAIARARGARVLENPWPGFAAQRRFALARAETTWVFGCDTDETVTPELARAVRSVVEADAPSPAGYRVRRRNRFLGAWIDVGPWADDRQLRLARRDAVRVTDAAVHEGFAVDGPVGELAPVLHHDTHPTLAESFRRMNVYTSLEAQDRIGRRRVGPLDPLLLPAGVWFKYYLLRGCWRAGIRGFLLAVTTAMYKSILYVKIRAGQTGRTEHAAR